MRRSKISVNEANSLFPVLKTLVAPILPEPCSLISLLKNIFVNMRYPQLNMMAMQAVGDTPDVERVFDIVGECIESIVEGETIHERVDFNDQELKVFLESLNTKQFTDIQNFFETMPKLQHIVEVENPKTKVVNTITLEGLQSFFD